MDLVSVSLEWIWNRQTRLYSVSHFLPVTHSLAAGVVVVGGLRWKQRVHVVCAILLAEPRGHVWQVK